MTCQWEDGMSPDFSRVPAVSGGLSERHVACVKWHVRKVHGLCKVACQEGAWLV